MRSRIAALAVALSTVPACTTIYQVVPVDDETTGEAVSSWPASTAGSSTGEPEPGSTTSSTGTSEIEDSTSTTGDAMESSSTGSTGNTSTTTSIDSTGSPEPDSTSGSTAEPSTSGADETTGAESSTSEPEPPPPVMCDQLDPGACGLGLCFAPMFTCSGDESYLPGGSLQPGEAKVVPSNDQQRVVHVLDLPAGQFNVAITPLTGDTKVDYRLYSATGVLTAAGAPAGVAQLAFDQAQPAVFLLVIGEVMAKPMTHEVKVALVPTKKHYDLCAVDGECLSNFCRASAFDAALRCLTPCTRATVLDCKDKGLPGLCVETGVDKTLLCAGDHTFGNDIFDNKKRTVGDNPAFGMISDANDVDVWLVDGSNAPAYYARFTTNGATAKLKGTWLDASGAVLAEQIVPKNASGFGPVRPVGSWTWLILTSEDGAANGYNVGPIAQ